MKLQNEKTFPKLYFGLHFVPGVAEYREPKKEPYRIYITDEAIRQMDRTFQGKPLYVLHKEEVNVETLREDADGYVIRSFYNEADGKTWAEFLVVSDLGHDAIQKGWRLSNAYVPTAFGEGGLWNGVEYEKELLTGEYEHLALVPDPRYDESIVLTPEAFNAYNERKISEAKKLSNSTKSQEESVLKFFKRAKVENGQDLENTVVELPKSKVEMTISDLVTEHDKVLNADGYADPDHKVKVGKEVMTVGDLAARHEALKDELEKVKKNTKKKRNTEKEEDEESETKKTEREEDDSKENESSEEETEKSKDTKDAKENEDEGGMEARKAWDDADETEDEADEERDERENKKNKSKVKRNSGHFERLKNAPAHAISKSIYLDLDGVERGKANYGSGK